VRIGSLHLCGGGGGTTEDICTSSYKETRYRRMVFFSSSRYPPRGIFSPSTRTRTLLEYIVYNNIIIRILCSSCKSFLSLFNRYIIFVYGRVLYNAPRVVSNMRFIQLTLIYYIHTIRSVSLQKLPLARLSNCLSSPEYEIK